MKSVTNKSKFSPFTSVLTEGFTFEDATPPIITTKEGVEGLRDAYFLEMLQDKKLRERKELFTLFTGELTAEHKVEPDYAKLIEEQDDSLEYDMYTFDKVTAPDGSVSYIITDEDTGIKLWTAEDILSVLRGYEEQVFLDAHGKVVYTNIKRLA